MGTETRIGIVSGLLIVVVASVYFFYGNNRRDEEILIAASPKPVEPVRIPVSSEKKSAPIKPATAGPAQTKTPGAALSPPKPAAPRPVAITPIPQAYQAPTQPIGPPVDKLAGASGIDKYRLPAPPAPADSTMSNRSAPTLLLTSPSPQLVGATKENLKTGAEASVPSAPSTGGATAAPSLPEPQWGPAQSPRVKLDVDPPGNGSVTSLDSSWPKKHRVVKGETLTELAKHYYKDAKKTGDIVAANPSLKGRRSLKAGEEIMIPEPKAVVELAKDTQAESGKDAAGIEKTYTVREGDTLYSIAKSQYGESKRWPEIFNLNKDPLRNDPKRLRPGMTLKLPD